MANTPSGAILPDAAQCSAGNVEEQPFKFMELPPEMRLRIYGLVLSPGEVYIRWDRTSRRDMRFAAWQRDAHPPASKAEVQLFLVSRTVRGEALPEYLANDLFYFMGTVPGIPYNWPATATSSAAHLRHLSIAFDQRAVDLNSDVSDITAEIDYSGQAHPHWNATQWRLGMHEALQGRLINILWEDIIEEIHQLKLHSLVVNLQNCFCPCGCRSLVEEAVRMLCSWASQACPQTIKFLGTRSAAERDLCRSLVEGARYDGEAGPIVEFAGIFLELHNRRRSPIWSALDELHVDSTDEAEPAEDGA
ncbi:hypothetical protein LTR85_005485 [Meristemomyces frigidus]|nr:hypothetical protein LTR85_005485 [Meristemomyces frigidus]